MLVTVLVFAYWLINEEGGGNFFFLFFFKFPGTEMSGNTLVCVRNQNGNTLGLEKKCIARCVATLDNTHNAV